MPQDPQTLAAAAAAGAFASELVKAAAKDTYSIVKSAGKSTIDRILRRSRGPALVQATLNISQFDKVLTEVQARDAHRLAERGASLPDPERAIEDPDKFHAFQAAASAASRTSSAERHRILAEALSMRFRADSDDDKAVIMTRAIDVIGTLGAGHLEVLGLLACIYGVRPPSQTSRRAALQTKLDDVFRRANEVYPRNKPRLDSLQGPERDAAAKAHNEEGKAILQEAAPIRQELLSIDTARSHQITELLTLHDAGWSASEQDVLYLSAAGCNVIERAVFRDLAAQFGEPELYGGHSQLAIFLDDALRAERFSPLIKGWERVLQHCVPTPIGFVIGLMVHDMKAPTECAQQWEWGELVPVVRQKQDWGGLTPREITETIVKETKRDVINEARRKDALGGIIR